MKLIRYNVMIQSRVYLIGNKLHLFNASIKMAGYRMALNKTNKKDQNNVIITYMPTCIQKVLALIIILSIFIIVFYLNSKSSLCPLL